MPHLGRTRSPFAGMLRPDFVPSTTTGAPEPVPPRQTKRAVPLGPMVNVHCTVIHLSRSGARLVLAIAGLPEVLSACARRISVLPLRLGDSVIHGPASGLTVLSWKMCVKWLVPCSVDGMYSSYVIVHTSPSCMSRWVPPTSMP